MSEVPGTLTRSQPYDPPVTLHPQAKAGLDIQPRVPLTLESLTEARRSMVVATPAEAGPGPDVPRVVDLRADGVPCRLYHPGGTGAGAVVFIHGGGWVLGDLDTHDALCRQLAVGCSRPVLAVGYRLAPEHPYPAAIEDVERAVAWLRGSDAVRLGLDVGPIAVYGDSAGGHLAAVAARRARDSGTGFAGQVLVCPVIDPEMRFPAMQDLGLTPAEMTFFWDAYAPVGVDRTHPDLAPLRADSAGLPPTLVITAEYDILRDEGERYAASLAAAGVSTVAVCYLGLTHGFARKLAVMDAAAAAAAQAAAALATMLDDAHRHRADHRAPTGGR